jgi:hypothetical protein
MTKGQTLSLPKIRKTVPCQSSPSNLELESGLSSASERWPHGYRSPPPKHRLRQSPRQHRDQGARACLMPHRTDLRSGFAGWSR